MMRMIAAFKKARFSLWYLIGFFLVLLGNFSFAISDFDRGMLFRVLTTRFDDSGNLSWKLRADEITPKGNSLYLVENPVLQTIHANGNITEANTSRGFFDLDEGKAEGPALMVVRGNGFGMSGIDWHGNKRVGVTDIECFSAKMVNCLFNQLNPNHWHPSTWIRRMAFQNQIPKGKRKRFNFCRS